MLIRVIVENFLSFNEKTEFTMVAGKATRHDDHIQVCNNRRILKGSFIFGANASGKTNLIKVASFAQALVLKGIERINFSKDYFRLDSNNKNKPGVFQFDIFTGGKFYSYGFAISYRTLSIVEEWLYEIGDVERCIFSRIKNEKQGFDVHSDIKIQDKKQRARFDTYLDDIKSNKMDKTLFLSDIAARSPDDAQVYQPFRDVIKWFFNLIIIFPESKYGGITRLLDNNDTKEKLGALLKYFDTGIETVSKVEIEFDKAFADVPPVRFDEMKAGMMATLQGSEKSLFVPHGDSLIEVKYRGDGLVAYEVATKHAENGEIFDYSDESDGTRRLFDLIPVYRTVVEDSVILIDELDRSLHTKAVQEFIRCYYQVSRGHNSQLIATTHDSNILDLEMLRQDEIWFIERADDHSSRVYSLNRFKARYDKRVDKDYLIGRYGAIPIFNRAELDSCLDRESDNCGKQ